MNQQRYTSALSSALHSSFAVVLASALLILPSSTQANDASDILEVTPKRCVTLRQGQPCFVRIRFEWQSTDDLQACLVDQDAVELMCWQSAKQGSFVLPQNLPNTTEYILIDSDGVELSRASVVVSWVYRKKRSKRRWRLF